jgi:predicted nucleic acid-binding protein
MIDGPSAVVLDSEGVSALVRRDESVLRWLVASRKAGSPVFASAATLVEGIDPQAGRGSINYGKHLVKVIPVTEETAATATDMLRKARLHGHTHALDAIVTATAARLVGPVDILTSDPDDITRLTQDYPNIQVNKL